MDIAIDFDGVIADIGVALQRSIFEITGNYVPFDRFYAYRIEETLGMTSEQVNQIARMVFDRGTKYLTPLRGSLNGIVNLLRDDHHVFIATSRKDKPTVERWLQMNYFPSLEIVSLGTGDKMKDADILLDDYPRKIFNLQNNIRIRSFLFAQPWNERAITLSDIFQRVRSWQHFLEQVYIINSKKEERE